MTVTDNSFTVDIDNDLDIESVETEDADNDTRAPREQTSAHVDEIKSQETEPVKLGHRKGKRSMTQTLRQVLRQLLPQSVLSRTCQVVTRFLKKALLI